MELPPSLHRLPPRYVPLPHHPPPPTPPYLPEDRNFYIQHHLRPPPPPSPLGPPPPPPPPQQSYGSLRPATPLPPPPPYNPHQSQFTILNHYQFEDDLRRPHHLDFPRRSPPRVFDRSTFRDDRPRLHVPEFENPFIDSRRDSWADPPKIPPKDRPPTSFEFEPRHHLQVSPFRTADHGRHNLDATSFRFREGFVDEFKPSYTEELIRGRPNSRETDLDSNYRHSRDHYIFNSSGSSRSSAFVDPHVVSNPSLSRDFGSKFGNYDSFPGSVSDSDRFRSNRDANRRWDHDRQLSRGLPDAPVESEKTEFRDDDVVQVASSRRVSHIYDSGKSNYKGSREGNQEFLRSPRKKIQKKSALLRLQFGKPHNRNRDDKPHIPSARADDSEPTTFRGRGPFGGSEKNPEEDREGSPVELDLSFKSNALVAKAIVASPSHSVESDRNSTPRNRKIKKLAVPEIQFSNLPVTKVSDGQVELNDSTHALDCPSTSFKDSKQYRENFVGSGGGDVGVGSQARNISSKEWGLDIAGDSVDSDRTSSIQIRKKKKLASTICRVPKLQETMKKFDPVTADRSTYCSSAVSQPGGYDMHSKEETASASMLQLQNGDTLRSTNELALLLEHNNSQGVKFSEKDGTDINPGGSLVRKVKRKRNSSTHLSGSSNDSRPQKMKVDECLVVVDSPDDLNTTSNIDQGPVDLQNGSAFTVISQVGGTSQQSCQNNSPVLLPDGIVEGNLEVHSSVGGQVLSSPQEIKIHGSHGNSYSIFHDVHIASSSDNGLIGEQLKVPVSVSDVVDRDAGSESNEATVIPETLAVEGFPGSIPSVEGTVVVALSIAEETNNQEGDFDAYGSNNYATATSGSESVISNPHWKIPFCEFALLDGRSKESYPQGTNLLLENVPMEGPPEARTSLAGNLLVGMPNKRKDGDIESDFVSPSASEMPVTAAKMVHPVDATSFRVWDLNFTEEEVEVSRADSQPCTDKDSVLDGYGLDNKLSVEETFTFAENGTSPHCTHKKEVCAPVSPSSMLSEAQEEPVTDCTTMFSVEKTSNLDGNLMPLEDNVTVSDSDTACSFKVVHWLESTVLSVANTDAGPSFDTMGLVGEGSTNGVSEVEQQCPCPSGLVEQIEKDALVITIMNRGTHIPDLEWEGRGGKFAASKMVEEPGFLHTETVQQGNPLEIQAPDTDRRQCATNMECQSYALVKDGLPDRNGVSATNLSDEMVESAPDKLLNVDSAKTQSIVKGSQVLSMDMPHDQTSNKNEKPAFDGLYSSYSSGTSLQSSAINKKSGHAVGSVDSINVRYGPQNARKTTYSLNSMSEEFNLRKNQLTSVAPGAFPGPSSSKKTASSTHIGNPRTWHRTNNPSASHMGKNSYTNPVRQGQLPRNSEQDQRASYIRKGNSLVRKSSLVASSPSVSHALSTSIYLLNPSGVDTTKQSTRLDSRVNISNPPSYLGTGLNIPLERPKTPPLPSGKKLANWTTVSSGNGASLPLEVLSQKCFSEPEPDPLKLKENVDVPNPSKDARSVSGDHENQTGQINNFESQRMPEDGNLVTAKSRKVVYVKRKSNQLIAASSSRDVSVQNVDKTEALYSNGYFKRRKNQLIRKSLETKPNIATPDDSLNSEGKRDQQVIAISSSGRQSGKGLSQTREPSKSSLVWTLRDAQSTKKENTLLRQAWPRILPWKRTRSYRNLMHNSVSVTNNSSLSTISRKLLLSRKRKTVYTRSTRGLSLRISKVMGVGGSSLKWSKSIERNSRKANKEATLAVAAVEKKKREQNFAGAANAVTKSRNHPPRKSVHSIELHPGERVFRVGFVRYKMDPTRRTLQRISDEELSNSAALQAGKDIKKRPVPKRLLIGNDEYVRIGNGNQLIRDPKKRTRILASEKVRWSLHTARLRLARKRMYCQFFTRFGKCNKDDGKCPYIHDLSKIAVCTKFLKGSCSDSNCKLTHKVIPERMQDCSYFLQGLCTNKSCPYRHVNVNTHASICEGFLKGYCADGNECRKKHSYVCPTFEATGICTQGSKCKLHHPQNRNKGRKRKPSSEQKYARGRYFGSKRIDLSEYKTAVAEKHSAESKGDAFCERGRFADYIHLDVSDEEVGEMNDPASEQMTSCDGDPTDGGLDVDELIKPIYVVNKSLITESSPDVYSPSENTAGNASEES